MANPPSSALRPCTVKHTAAAHTPRMRGGAWRGGLFVRAKIQRNKRETGVHYSYHWRALLLSLACVVPITDVRCSYHWRALHLSLAIKALNECVLHSRSRYATCTNHAKRHTDHAVAMARNPNGACRHTRNAAQQQSAAVSARDLIGVVC